MAQPLDIRVAFQPERGFTIIVEGQELNTAGMGNHAVLWNVVLYLVQRLPDDGRMEELQMAAMQMTEFFRHAPPIIMAPPPPVAAVEVERPNNIRQREVQLFLLQQMEECPPPLLPEEEGGGEEECSICCDNPAGEQWVRLLSCNHMFHARCIASWADNQTCPLCREDLSRNTRRRRV